MEKIASQREIFVSDGEDDGDNESEVKEEESTDDEEDNFSFFLFE